MRNQKMAFVVLVSVLLLASCGLLSFNSIGGAVSGLAGTMVLENGGSAFNRSEDLTIGSNGSFAFKTRHLNGTSYNVTVKTQPENQICLVDNGKGTISDNDVTDIKVTCTSNSYSGRLIGLRWNSSSSAEEFGSIDPATGEFSVIGTVGDLKAFMIPPAVDGTTLYAIGNQGPGGPSNNYLYTLDTVSGSLISKADLSGSFIDGHGPALAGVDANGKLIGLRWNSSSSVEEFGAIDPATGGFAVIGTVGDLKAFVVPAVVGGNTLYVIGHKFPDTSKMFLYTVDTVSGSLIKKADLSGSFINGYGPSLAGVSADGKLIGLRWNSTTSTEEFGSVDPATGGFSVIGTVGDLKAFMIPPAVSGTALYAIGNQGPGGPLKNYLYTIDTVSGSLINKADMSSAALNGYGPSLAGVTSAQRQPKSEQQIREEFSAIVESANSCSADEQCISISPGCPLGCSAFINASEKDRVRKAANDLIHEWSYVGPGVARVCDYSCIPTGPAVCVSGKCQEGKK